MAKILPVTPSLLNRFLTCPRQYENSYITKEFPYVQNEAAAKGDRIHKSFEATMKTNVPLIDEAAFMQKYVNWCFVQATKQGMEMHVEADLAVTRDFTPTTWRGTREAPPYMRGKADMFFVDHANKMSIIVDWKTGKVKQDMTQANILATCARHHTGYTKVLCLWVFVVQDELLPTTLELTDLNPITHTLQDIARYERACKDDKFPATPNGLCKAWCDVLSCPHNGKNPANVR